MMGVLSDDLRNMGYEPTGRESPFDEEGELWTKGYELVCDETGFVIRKDNSRSVREYEPTDEKVYKYRNSKRVKLLGGYLSSYEWGYDDDRFRYY